MHGLLCGVAACLLLSACASTTRDDAAPAPPIGPVPTNITDPSQITRPIDAFLLPADQIVVLEQAKIRTAQQCMRDAGYVTTVTADSDMAPSIRAGVEQRTTASDLYGFFSSDTAAQTTGYLAGSPTGTYEVTWTGDVPGSVSDGCWKKAADASAGGVYDSSQLTTATGLPGGGPPVPASDPTYSTAVRKWSACMSARGFGYQDPLQSIADQSWISDRRSGVASSADVATAVADLQCKRSTNLIGVAVAVQAAYDQQYIDAHTTQLDIYWRGLQSALNAH